MKSMIKIPSLTSGNKDLCMEWLRKCMMTNMKAVLLTDESRALPNDPDGLMKGWIFNGDNCSVGILLPQSYSMVRIWGRMIRNERTDLFCVPEELKLPGDVYCWFRKKSVEAQLKKSSLGTGEKDHLLA